MTGVHHEQNTIDRVLKTFTSEAWDISNSDQTNGATKSRFNDGLMPIYTPEN